MIPGGITADHIRAAIERLDAEGVPDRRRSRTYQVVHEGKRYPPKLVISLAHEEAFGVPLLPSRFTGGASTNGFLRQRGFVVEGGSRPEPAAHSETRQASRANPTGGGRRSDEPGAPAREVAVQLVTGSLRTFGDVVDRRAGPPAAPGLYGWYARGLPPQVPLDGCLQREGLHLVYVGIAGSRAQSSATLRGRLRQHFLGPAEASTLRMTLGSLLADELSLTLVRSVSGRQSFGADGERRLTEWMVGNMRVCWCEHEAPWTVEAQIIRAYSLPLNLRDNGHHPFAEPLSAARRLLRQGVRRPEAGDGHGRTVCLVSCVSAKHAARAQAQNLYTSPWFGYARRYAEANADAWYILSARYGLVAPEAVIEPYEETLNRMGSSARKAWAGKVLAGLRPLLDAGDRVVILAGVRYRESLIPSLEAHGFGVDVPMEGLRIGEQLSWLKRYARTGS